MDTSSESELDSYDSSSAIERKIAYGNRHIIPITDESRREARQRRLLHKIRKREKRRTHHPSGRSTSSSSRKKFPIRRKDREESDSAEEGEGMTEYKRFARRKMRPPSLSDDSDAGRMKLPRRAQEPFATLARVDPLFTGCLTDFKLSEPEITAAKESCPPLPEEFREGAVVASTNSLGQEAFEAGQLGVRYQTAAYRLDAGT
jgi:hypothetical protein